MYREAGVIMSVQFLEGPPSKLWQGDKTSKIRRYFWNFPLWSRISPERFKLSKIGKKHFDCNSGELWSTSKKFYWLALAHPNGLFGGDILALRGCCPSNYYTRLRSVKACWRIPKTFNRENLKFGLKFSVLATITSGLVGLSSCNFSMRRTRSRGDNAGIILEDPPS